MLGLAEEFLEAQGASMLKDLKPTLKHLKKYTTRAKAIQKSVKKKRKKRGPAHWLGDKCLLDQIMCKQGPMNTEAAAHLRIGEVKKRRDLTPEEKKMEYKSIMDQMKAQFHGMRGTMRAKERAEEELQKRRDEVTAGDTEEAIAEHQALLSQMAEPQSSEEEEGEKDAE